MPEGPHVVNTDEQLTREIHPGQWEVEERGDCVVLHGAENEEHAVSKQLFDELFDQRNATTQSETPR